MSSSTVHDEEKVAPSRTSTSEKAGALVGDDEHVQKFQSDVDITVGLVAAHGAYDDEISPEESHRLRVKLDWRLLPVLWMLYTRA